MVGADAIGADIIAGPPANDARWRRNTGRGVDVQGDSEPKDKDSNERFQDAYLSVARGAAIKSASTFREQSKLVHFADFSHTNFCKPRREQEFSSEVYATLYTFGVCVARMNAKLTPPE
jgi:hypothetical protein